MKKIASLLLLTCCAFAHAQGKGGDMQFSPHSIQLTSFDNNNFMEMNCDGEKPFLTLDCRFTVTAFTAKTEADKKKSNDELSKLDSVTQRDIDQLKKYYKELFDQKAKDRYAKMGPWQRAYHEKFLEFSKSIANVKDKNDLKLKMAEYNKIEDETCRVDLVSWEVRFKKISSTKWGTSTEPQGLCNLVTYSEIESDKESHLLWKYSTTRLSVEEKSSVCSSLKQSVGKRETYTWEAPRTMMPPCKYLEFR